MTDQEAIRGLRDALKVSPDNVPLRLHFAMMLMRIGLFEDAAYEYRQALVIEPHNHTVKLGLASAYERQGKSSQAMVVIEDIVAKSDAPAAAYIQYARMLLRSGSVQDAVAQYKLAIDIDPQAADKELGDQLGVGKLHQGDSSFQGQVRDLDSSDSATSENEIERPSISFEDVGGMEELKEEIRLKILYPIQHPEMYEAYGKKIGGGILLYGPPGCGKTYLARATAGEIGAGFLSVGISDVLEMWLGQSERNLTRVFEQARYNKPCVLFFDEVDALGGRRSDMITGAGRQVINQFLYEMDGVDKNNDGVLILAATNAPWHVDAAFRRPGRFDRVLFVPPPDGEARSSILRIHLKGKPQEDIDHKQIAKRTTDFSGADLKALVDQAIESKLRDALKAGIPHPLTTKDLLATTQRLRPTTQEWFSTARNYAIYSNQGGIYDDVLRYLKL